MPPAGYDDDGYLIEDDKPQPSVDHQRQTAHWREALALHLPAATVCSDLTVHCREGDRGAAIVPDLFVALRAPPLEERTSYKLWQYPVPELVAEMLSEDTAKDDVGSKQYTYAYLPLSTPSRQAGVAVGLRRILPPRARRRGPEMTTNPELGDPESPTLARAHTPLVSEVAERLRVIAELRRRLVEERAALAKD